jgi:hypothetical protein
MLQRGRTLALGGEVDDHLRLLAVEQFHQQIELVVHVVGVVAVARIALADAERETFVFRQVAADGDNLAGVGVVEQIFRRVKTERSTAAEHSISLLHRPGS